MTELILRLFELLREFWQRVCPWTILNEDEIGLVLRFGRYHRDLQVGWNWKWPLIEFSRHVIKALDTNLLAKQTLTTLDGHTVALRGIITYRVTDGKRYILDCNEADSVLNDTGAAAIARLVPRYDLATVLSGDVFRRALLRYVRRRARPYGIYVKSFGLSDAVKLQAFRLMGDQ